MRQLSNRSWTSLAETFSLIDQVEWREAVVSLTIPLPTSPHSCSPPVLNDPHPKPHTLNAVTPLAEPAEAAQAARRKSRHLAQCEELAELGLSMARHTAAIALAQPIPEPTPEPTPAPIAQQPNHAIAFARLACAVRHAITLEARIAADAFQPRAPAARAHYRPTRPDPRRAPLRQAVHDAVRTDPDRARIRRALDTHIEDELAADTAQETPLWDILEATCEAFGLTLDPRRLPDSCLPPAPEDTPPLDMDAFCALIEADWQSRAPPATP